MSKKPKISACEENSEREINSCDTHVHPALKKYFGYCMKKLNILMQKRLTSALEPIGICPPHYGILIILNEKPDYNQLKLGEELGFDKATMVKLIDELEKKDFLNRITHSTDRRQKLIVMTEKGRKSLEKAKKISKSLEEKLMSYITKEEEVILKKVIPELLEQLSEEANKQKIDF